MAGMSGWPSQKKITYANKTYNEFVTVQPIASDKNGFDVLPKSAFRNSVLKTVEAGSTDQIIVATAHNAVKGDYIRFENGAFQYFEVAVVDVTANAIYLGTKLPAAPALTDTYYIMRYVSPLTDSSGSIISTSGPIQYNLDSIATTVNEDTVTPANSTTLPVGLFSPGGERITSTTDGARKELDVSPGPVEFNLDGVVTEVSQDTVTPGNSVGLPSMLLAPTGLEQAYGAGVTGPEVQRVVLPTDMPPVKTGLSYLNSARLDYGVTNVSNAAWTQLLASVGASDVEQIMLFDGGGYAMELGIGAAASETRMLLIPPGGFNGNLPVKIPAGSRLSVRAVGAALVNLGEIDLNLLG